MLDVLSTSKVCIERKFVRYKDGEKKMKSWTEFSAASLSYVQNTFSNPVKKFDDNSVLVF